MCFYFCRMYVLYTKHVHVCEFVPVRLSHLCIYVCLLVLCVHVYVQIAFNHHHHIQPPPPPHATNTTTYTTSTTTTCCCHHHMQQPIPHILVNAKHCGASLSQRLFCVCVCFCIDWYTLIGTILRRLRSGCVAECCS